MVTRTMSCPIPVITGQLFSTYQPTLLRGALGPTISSGWLLVAMADFNGDGHSDYLLYDPVGRRTAIWYLNNNVYVSAAFGPTLPMGWSLVVP